MSYVRLEFDLTTGEDIEKALGNLSDTSTAYLKPNCNQRNQSEEAHLDDELNEEFPIIDID
ncbi:14023_t:CDS:2, partial [Racocetra fulgida]